jgi:hypothetical protein
MLPIFPILIFILPSLVDHAVLEMQGQRQEAVKRFIHLKKTPLLKKSIGAYKKNFRGKDRK